MQNKEKEPLVHIVRQLVPPKHAWLIRLIAVVLALLVCALFAYLSIGISPIAMYGTMLRGAFGGSLYIAETLAYATKLLLIAVALAPAFRMRFWNIGGEGQVLIGGLAAAACMIYFKNLPTIVLLLVMMIASAIAGGIWGFFPGIFKAQTDSLSVLRENINEGIQNVMRVAIGQSGKNHLTFRAPDNFCFIGDIPAYAVGTADIFEFSIFYSNGFCHYDSSICRTVSSIDVTVNHHIGFI